MGANTPHCRAHSSQTPHHSPQINLVDATVRQKLKQTRSKRHSQNEIGYTAWLLLKFWTNSGLEIVRLG